MTAREYTRAPTRTRSRCQTRPASSDDVESPPKLLLPPSPRLGGPRRLRMIGVALRNPRFRRLWLSQVVSQAGDWLNRIAILVLIRRVGGPEAAVGVGALYGVELLVRMLPTAIVGPTLAGPLADRLPRRLLMVGADLVRAAVVLGFLTVREPGDLPRLYALLVAQMGFSICFNAAKSAAVPDTVPRAELHEAWVLTSATWSIMLGVGAFVGGVLVDAVGVRNVFLIDAATYVASALLLIGLRLPPPPEQPEPLRVADLLLLRDVRRGLAHVRALGLLPVLLAKTFWGGCGGFLVVLAIAGTERFGAATGLLARAASAPPAESGGFATGVLYAARGLGTALGPILARRWLGSADADLRRQIAGGFLVGAAGYALFARAQTLAVGLVWIVGAHAGGSALWVASTTYWQRHVADAFRGRIFAIEFLGMTVAFSAAGVLAGALYDATGSFEWTVWSACLAVVAAGLAWRGWARSLPDRPEATPGVPAEH